MVHISVKASPAGLLKVERRGFRFSGFRVLGSGGFRVKVVFDESV